MPHNRRERDLALERRTGQYVVRQRESKIYSYIPPEKKENKKKKDEGGFNAVDLVYVFIKFLLFAAAALLTAFLVFKAYPKSSVSAFVWVAFVPFLAALRKTKTFKGSVSFGVMTGFFTCGGLFYWIYYTCMAGGVTPQLSLLALAGLSLIISLQFALFSGLSFYIRKTGIAFIFFAATGWVTVEFFHQILAYKILGFPWFMLGYSQWNRPEFLQFAAYGGVYAVSFIIVLVNASLAVALTVNDFVKRFVAVFIAFTIFFGAFIFGKQVLDIREPEDFTSIRVALLQPNIDLYKKWDAAFEHEIEDRLTELITYSAQSNPDLIVWPESALPGPIEHEYYGDFAINLAKMSKAYQVVGSNREGADGKQYVSAFLVNPAGEFKGIYDKETLVPFGEYVPLQHRLENLGVDLGVVGQMGVFTKGSDEQPLLEFKGIKFGTTICYESIFHKTWMRAAEEDARFFVNITNDGWYLDTSAPYQHFAVNVVRAVEYGKPVIRSANTGISAVIDGKGRILQASELNTAAVVEYELPLYDEEPTFYTHWGDIFSYICMVVFLTCALAGFVISNE
ncbi:apolipoprotein N-acyltransferase [Elusimicrobium posterum]|uniref:apolipoprotein N-acyltransferase n=1 Tax=Elusimicrobium posterum TaxID=3116653 RepID=UPI003C730DC2